MTRQERAICTLWDTLRDLYPNTPDKRLYRTAVDRYRKEFHDDITPSDILAALEARANE